MLDYSQTPGYAGVIYYVKCPTCDTIMQKCDINPNIARVECHHCHRVFVAYYYILEEED